MMVEKFHIFKCILFALFIFDINKGKGENAL